MAAFHQIGVSRVQSTKCCPPRPLRILALSLALLILLIHSASAASAYGTIGSAGAGAVSHHHSLSKRSYFDINCKGLYDKSIFARLDRICQDCYSLYREPELHTLCRSECFSTPFFKACLKVLLMEDQDPDYSDMIERIG